MNTEQNRMTWSKNERDYMSGTIWNPTDFFTCINMYDVAWQGMACMRTILIANENDDDYEEHMEKNMCINAEPVWCIGKWNAVFQTWICTFRIYSVFLLQWNANAWMFNDKEEKCSGKVNTLASKLIDEYAKSWRASLALHFPQSFEMKCICMPIPDSLEAHIHTHSCV